MIAVLENPAEIVAGSQTAKFAEPVYLGVDGLGIKSLIFVEEQGEECKNRPGENQGFRGYVVDICCNHGRIAATVVHYTGR